MATIATRTDVYRDKLPFHGLGPESGGNALEVQTIFRGQLIATHHLNEPGGVGRGRSPAQDVIGATADADAPAAPEVIGGVSLPLVTTWGQDYHESTQVKDGINLRPQHGAGE